MNYSLEQMRALSGQTTSAIYEVLVREGERSPSELQARLRMRSKSLFYHLHKLVQTGLVECRTAGRRTLYQAVERNRLIPSGYMGLDAEVLAAKMVGARLRNTSRRFMDVAIQSEERPELADFQWIASRTFRATPEALSTFKARFYDLLAEVAGGDDGHEVSLVMVASPVIDPPKAALRTR